MVVMKTAVTTAAGLVGTVMILAGCSHGSMETPANPELGLHFQRSGDVASLAYGVANSDSVGLMLQCEAGSRSVDISDVARSTASNNLTLISGKARTDLAATVDSSMGQPTLWAKAPSDLAPLQRFRDTGQITVSSRGGRYSVVARQDERARVERFFRACEQRA
jgi:hypothetical protein